MTSRSICSNRNSSDNSSSNSVSHRTKSAPLAIDIANFSFPNYLVAVIFSTYSELVEVKSPNLPWRHHNNIYFFLVLSAAYSMIEHSVTVTDTKSESHEKFSFVLVFSVSSPEVRPTLVLHPCGKHPPQAPHVNLMALTPPGPDKHPAHQSSTS